MSNYRCDPCTYITGTVTYSSTLSQTVITPTNTVSNLENEGRVCLRVTGSVPVSGMTAPVTITVNGANAFLLDKFGNVVYGASLRTNTVIKGYYGTNGINTTAHLQVLNQPFTYYNN